MQQSKHQSKANIHDRQKTKTRAKLAPALLAGCTTLASIPSTAHAREFRYDAANRLRETRDADRVTTYEYDGWGQLTRLCFESDTDPLECNDVVIDELPEHVRVVGVRSPNEETLVAHDPTGPVARRDQADVDLLLRDRLGSVRATTPDGQLHARRVYDVYGDERQNTPSGLAHGYTGELTDATGMVYLRARHLLPTAGRFVQRDTIAPVPDAPQTLNRYTYVAGGNPLAATDPSGHFLVALGAVAIGAALLWADALSLGANAPETADDPSRHHVNEYNSFAGQGRRVAAEAAAELATVGTFKLLRRFLPRRLGALGSRSRRMGATPPNRPRPPARPGPRPPSPNVSKPRDFAPVPGGFNHPKVARGANYLDVSLDDYGRLSGEVSEITVAGGMKVPAPGGGFSSRNPFLVSGHGNAGDNFIGSQAGQLFTVDDIATQIPRGFDSIVLHACQGACELAPALARKTGLPVFATPISPPGATISRGTAHLGGRSWRWVTPPVAPPN